MAKPKSSTRQPPARTRGYRPSVRFWGGFGGFGYNEDIPYLTVWDIERMVHDPQINFALRVLKSPIYTTTWKIKGPSKVSEFVDKQLKTIWKDLDKPLRMIEYGTAAGEAVIGTKKGYKLLHGLRDVHLKDAKPLVDRKGQLAGINVHNIQQKYDTDDRRADGKVTLLMPYGWWIANESRYGSLWGESRLRGAYYAWVEKRGEKGGVESRRLWFMKNCFDGGVLRHPVDSVEDESSNEVSAQSYAQRLLQLKETGGILVIPHQPDPVSGEQMWEYTPPQSNGELGGLHEYMEILDMEILKGVGVPPEVVQAGETGSGYAGRAIPAIVFYKGLDQIVDNIISTFDEQVIRCLVRDNFGDIDYEIEPETLVPQDDEQGGQGGLADMMGQMGQPQEAQDAMTQEGSGEEQGAGTEEELDDPLGDLVNSIQLGLEHPMLANLAFDPKDWKPHKIMRGPRKGQTVYKHTRTGRLMDKLPDQKGQKRQGPTKGKVLNSWLNLWNREEPLTQEEVNNLGDQLLQMTTKDVKELKKQFGVKASGNKREFALKVAARAVDAVNKAKGFAPIKDAVPAPGQKERSKPKPQDDKTEKVKLPAKKTQLKPKTQEQPTAIAQNVQSPPQIKLDEKTNTASVLEKHYKNYVKSLPKDVKNQIHAYTLEEMEPGTINYHRLNESMRACPPEFRCLDKKEKEVLDVLENAIQNAPPLPEPQTVYRGVQNLDPETKQALVDAAKKAMQASGEFRMPSITSTTANLSSLSDFVQLGDEGSVVFHIVAKKGLYVADLSEATSERELLQSSQTRYRVANVAETDFVTQYSNSGAARTTTIYLEEVD